MIYVYSGWFSYPFDALLPVHHLRCIFKLCDIGLRKPKPICPLPLLCQHRDHWGIAYAIAGGEGNDMVSKHRSYGLGFGKRGWIPWFDHVWSSL